MRDQIAWVENAEMENEEPNCGKMHTECRRQYAKTADKPYLTT